jgi:hypothetical protein
MHDTIAHEFAALDLKDARLDKRAATLLTTLAKDSQGSIPQACNGLAQTVAAYRFFDNEKVTFAALLDAHRKETLRRAALFTEVLLIQDSTDLDYSAKAPIEGAGTLAYDGQQGFRMHSLIAASPAGMMLGTVHAQIDALPAVRVNKTRHKRAIEKKGSYRWLHCHELSHQLAQELKSVRFINLSDREGDIYECFDLYQSRLREGLAVSEWIIRACQNRNLPKLKTGEVNTYEKLFEAVKATPVMGEHRFECHRGKRVVRQQVRAATLLLKPPYRPDKKLESVPVNIVVLSEIDPPAGEAAIEWILLTSLPIDTLENALRVASLYEKRWLIEDFHRTLKSGCRIENMQFKNAERLRSAIALYLIVAWNILYLRDYSRQHPEQSGTVIFSSQQWKVLWLATKKSAPPNECPTLATLVGLIGQLGGYLGRKRDGPPGPKTLWLGLRCLANIIIGMELAKSLDSDFCV